MRGYVLSLFSILRARRDRWQPRLDQLLILVSEALENKTKEIIAEPQDDFSSFIPLSMNYWSISLDFGQWYTLSQCGVP